ncbi:cytochrome P450 [Kitasatospora sp. NPDC101157]|uniref:cytochrome P450 family protein n=1 Tax=Kitasatospora sp. NPDC101157 TaxID=3364098 RepID=UPI00381E152A
MASDAYVSGSIKENGDPDPYPNYAWLREHAPVSEVYTPHRAGTTWLVTTYDLARACLLDPRLSNDDRNSAGAQAPFGTGEWDPARGLLDLDRPEHTRLRRLVAGAFGEAAVARMRGTIARTAHRAVDTMTGPDGCDLVEHFSLPVPVAVIHEVLGIPPELREPPARCLDLFYHTGLTDPPDVDRLARLLEYTAGLAAYKRTHPGPDVGTHLVRGLESGQLRDENELAAMILSVIGAGHVTTVQFLGTAVYRLLQHPDQLAAIRAGRIPWKSAVNELMRYDAPIQSTAYRFATEPIELGGVRIGKGDALLISLGSANRDPARFPDPDVFRADRGGPGHLGFGHGAHRCLGAHLARLEGEVALDVLFRRLPGIELAVPFDEVVWTYGPMLRGPRTLPVRLPATAPSRAPGNHETTI